MYWHAGIWSNGKKKVTGFWRYYWAGDYFIIQLDGTDKEIGIRRSAFNVYRDVPEWGKFKLIEQEKKKKKKNEL